MKVSNLKLISFVMKKKIFFKGFFLIFGVFLLFSLSETTASRKDHSIVYCHKKMKKEKIRFASGLIFLLFTFWHFFRLFTPVSTRKKKGFLCIESRLLRSIVDSFFFSIFCKMKNDNFFPILEKVCFQFLPVFFLLLY